MKKTLIINIGNSIIHIEEDAYEILTTYLNEIKQHFAKSADDFEIVTDIENRIAEMCAEILQAGQKQVIDLVDVQGVIAQMGRVQDFQSEEESAAAPDFEAYQSVKKLYRDTEEGVIAGVCVGLGYYLAIEARWIRLAAFLSIFLGGSGILAYLILWIAMPRAVSRTEKMAMKGKAANLHGYQKSFEEELAAFKENMKSANAQFQPLIAHSSNFINEFFTFLGKFIAGAGRLIMKVIATAFIIFGFLTLVFLIIGLCMLLGFWDSHIYNQFPFSIINGNFRDEIILGAFVVFFVPILALVLFAMKVTFQQIKISKTLSFSLLLIWLVGIGSTGYHAAKISSDFQEHAELVKSTELKAYPTYVLDIDQSMSFSKADSLNYNIKELEIDNRVIVDDGTDHPFSAPRNVRVRIEKSDNDKTIMLQTYEANGKNFQTALQNAQNIDYKYTMNGAQLMLSPRLHLKKQSIWRKQEVRITLKVPVGTRLLIDQHIYNYLQFYYYSCSNDDNKNNNYREWIMTADGLKCKSEVIDSSEKETSVNP